MMTNNTNNAGQMSIAIIGAGPLGIAAGRELLKQGFSQFTIFEKERAAGGTWHIHSYPGLACDVWAHAYTFSYAPNPNWSSNFVGHAEIEAYLQDCAQRFGLESHMQFNTRITRAKFNGQQWQLSTEQGDSYDFEVVINAMGNQHTPVMPAIEGIDEFAGDSWHSTEWRHDVDLAGKRVVVVGSAASAVQIVPEVARVAARLTILQRSPNWILPRGRKAYSPRVRRLFQRWPVLTRLLRWGQGKLMQMMHKGAILGSRQMNTFENMGRKYIEKSISDPALREAITPDSRFGCKRPLVADDYYPALNRDNVQLFAEGARAVNAAGVVTASGRQIDADVIIYCTGYRVLDFDRIEVVGRDGQNLAEQLASAPEAYMGIAVPGFPNYFLGMGPNGVVLSVSYFISAETNVRAIVKLLTEMRQQGKRVVEVKKQLHRDYNDWLVEQFPRFAWADSACQTYYSTAGGQHPFLFPGDFKTFRRQREQVGLDAFEVLSG